MRGRGAQGGSRSVPQASGGWAGVGVDPEHSERRPSGRGASSARDPDGNGNLAASEEPFDRWFRGVVRDVHGIDLAAGFEPPEQVLDFRG